MLRMILHDFFHFNKQSKQLFYFYFDFHRYPDDSPTNQLAISQFVDWSTERLDNLQTSKLVTEVNSITDKG